MVEAKTRHFDGLAWNRTAALLIQLQNVALLWIEEKDRRGLGWVNPMKCYPWGELAEQKPAPPPTPEQIAMLEDLFPGRK